MAPSITSVSLWNQASCSSEPPGLTMTSPGPQTHCSVPRRNSILPLSIQTIGSFAMTVAMKVLVCGGRNFRSPAQVFRALDRLHQEKPITELMQGGATGADQFAMEWAATKPEIKRYVCHADWETHGRAAGPIRNEKMLTWKPDLVVA